MTRTKNRLPAIACPHCSARMITRSSWQQTPTVREMRLDCDNIECGFVATAQIAIVSTRQRSLRPRMGIDLPVRPANDDNRCPANDDDAPEVASTTLNG